MAQTRPSRGPDYYSFGVIIYMLLIYMLPYILIDANRSQLVSGPVFMSLTTISLSESAYSD